MSAPRAWRRSLLGMLSLASALTAAPSALGQATAGEAPLPLAEALTGDAKRDYEAAILLYGSGDFAGAERRFSSAYELSHDVRLLWNAAACEQGQRHYSRAITLMRRYLSSGSPLITEEATRSAQAFLDAAIPLTARLVISANEPGARLYLDEELLGTLPLGEEARVDFGTHRVAVRKPQFVEAFRIVTVTSAADLRLDFELQPVVHRGRLVIRASSGDSISVDGRFRALSAFDGAVTSGRHRVRVTASGSRPFETELAVEDDGTRAIDVTLERAPLVSRVPGWAWIVGGAALLAGAGATTYFLVRSPEADSASLPSGSAGRVQLPLR